MDWSRFSHLSISSDRSRALIALGKWVLGGLGLSYVAAVTVSSWLVGGMTRSALSALEASDRAWAKAIPVTASFGATGPTANYRDIEKAIRDRNLFNSSGEFPDESKSDGKGEEKKTAEFDINAPCNKPTVNLELLGTIYLEGGASLATLKEQGYSESDVYKEGDAIIGAEQAAVARIERNRVIVNNKGVKECIELAAGGKKKDSPAGAFPDTPPSAPEPPPGGESTGGDCAMDEKYVQDELGPGFGTIIQKARLVPNTVDNQMNGFKIFAIEQGSLLGKIGLNNGDIITQVNDTSLKQPEQGFTLYQAFQDEREVRIHILRRGTTPMMITCRIK